MISDLGYCGLAKREIKAAWDLNQHSLVEKTATRKRERKKASSKSFNIVRFD